MENLNQLISHSKLLDSEKIEKLKGYNKKISEYNNMIKRIEEINFEDLNDTSMIIPNYLVFMDNDSSLTRPLNSTEGNSK